MTIDTIWDGSVRLPPGDDPLRRHIENVAFDSGMRTALREQFKALLQAAEAQVKRSFQTSDGPFASDDYETRLCLEDMAFRDAILALAGRNR